MKKWIKYVLILAIGGLIIGSGVVYYVFNKPHRDIQGEEASYVMTAGDLYAAFGADETASTAKYADQVIEVTGEIVELSKDAYDVSIVLNDAMEGVNCELDSAAVMDNGPVIEALSIGDEVTLKGKCDGYDMIMGVVLTRCYIIE